MRVRWIAAALTLALFCWYMHRRPRQAEDALQQRRL